MGVNYSPKLSLKNHCNRLYTVILSYWSIQLIYCAWNMWRNLYKLKKQCPNIICVVTLSFNLILEQLVPGTSNFITLSFKLTLEQLVPGTSDFKILLFLGHFNLSWNFLNKNNMPVYGTLSMKHFFKHISCHYTAQIFRSRRNGYWRPKFFTFIFYANKHGITKNSDALFNLVKY